MDCLGIKRFLNRNCCSCRIDDSSLDEVRITKISKISASGSIHSILEPTDRNNHDYRKKETPRRGNVNLAFESEKNPSKRTDEFTEPKVCKEQPNYRYDRQISEISDFSPTTNEKGLTEMVLEEIDKSFSLNKEKLPNENISTEIKHRPDELNGEPNTKTDINKIEKSQKVSTTHLDNSVEWRNKLVEDLNETEDFVLTSDEESESEDEVENITGKSERHDQTSRSIPAAETIDDSISRTNSSKYGGTPVVIDIGSYEMKAGMAGEYAPVHSIRSITGSWKTNVGDAFRKTGETMYFGEEAIERRNTLSLKYPIVDGNVVDWRDFEAMLDYILCQLLEIDVKDCPLLITEPAIISDTQREKKLEIIMESLHCPVVQFSKQAVMSCLSTGKDVSMVVNSGHGFTEIVPTYHGHAIKNAIQRTNVGGRHITEYLQRLLLTERGSSFNSIADENILNSIKHKHAQVKSEDSVLIDPRMSTIPYELPDGRTIELGAELYQCTEPMFNPGLIGNSEDPGVVELIQRSLKRMKPEIQEQMKASLLLSGGNCALQGFKKQTHAKLSENNSNKSWNVMSCENLINSSWLGGSLYASSPEFFDTCITDDLYFEHGLSILHKTGL